MEPNAKYIFVGASLIILVVVFVVAALWLAGSGQEGEDHIFAVYFKQQTVAGLQIGSDVTMRGIKVAKVRSLRILPEESQGVLVTIRMNDDTPIRTNQVAVIQRNILTGLATIELQTGNDPGQILKAGTTDENAPAIKEGKDTLQSLRMSFEEIMLNINNSLSRLNNFFTPENQANLEQTLRNIRDLTGRASARLDEFTRLDEFKGAGEQTTKLIEETRDFVKETTKTLSALRKTTTEGATILSLKGTELADSMEKAAGGISSTADRYKDPRGILFGPASGSLGPGEGIQQ